MDEEKKKMGLKRKPKPIETSVDSNDDEPIGALLKIKNKRNSKKSKLADGGGEKVKGVEKIAAEDEELGGMDDTLANFRKKLRGPKKDGRSAVEAGKDLGMNMVEPLSQSRNEAVKDLESDLNLISETQKRYMESTEGGSSGDPTVTEGLKVKAKMKNNRSKVKSDAKIMGNSGIDCGFGYNRSGNDTLQHRIEGGSESEAEAFEDSLSAFFQKVQGNSSRLRPGKETQVYDEGSKPNPGADSKAPDGKFPSASKFIVPNDNSHASPGQDSTEPTLNCQSVADRLLEGVNCTSGNPTDSNQRLSSGTPDKDQILRSPEDLGDSSTKLITENSAVITLLQSSPSRLRACSATTAGVEDGEINIDAIGVQPGPTDVPSNSNNIIDGNNEIFHCAEAKDMGLSISSCEGIAKITGGVNLDSGFSTDLGSKPSGQIQLHSSSFASHRVKEEHPSGDTDGPVTVLVKCSEETDLAPFSSEEADNRVPECRSPTVSASKRLKNEGAFWKQKDGSAKVVSESEHVLEPSRVLPEGACPTNCDDPSEDEEVNGIHNSSVMLDHQGNCAEDTGSIADPETKENSLSVGLRAARNAKKNRHGDMAYEGDIDWEVLMQSQEFFVSNQILDKTREKFNSSSSAVDAENGKAAAVAAGLKARAAGPLEKIKFKEVLKRKGGLQEYLECRSVPSCELEFLLFLNAIVIVYMILST